MPGESVGLLECVEEQVRMFERDVVVRTCDVDDRCSSHDFRDVGLIADRVLATVEDGDRHGRWQHFGPPKSAVVRRATPGPRINSPSKI